MATDSFTNSDGTKLEAHNANWTLIFGASATREGTINSNRVGMAGNFQTTGSYYSGSSSDNCQFVKQGHAALANNRFQIAVRAGGSTRGYHIMLNGLSGDNFTTCELQKNGSFLAAGGVSVSRLSDITMRVRATANGGNQDIEAWINGSQVTWTGPASTIYTDATSPLTTGSPGFFLTNSGAQAESYWDDFDDLTAAADPEGSLIGGKLIRGGLLMHGVLGR